VKCAVARGVVLLGQRQAGRWDGYSKVTQVGFFCSFRLVTTVRQPFHDGLQVVLALHRTLRYNMRQNVAKLEDKMYVLTE
jgi:hypothetical protein